VYIYKTVGNNKTQISTGVLPELRHKLHKFPELSGMEKGTADIIVDFLRKYKPDEILQNIGGYGVAAYYHFGDGPTVMLRCDLDALPVHEDGNLEYKSQKKGVSHKCGHDGHMTIMSALAPWLSIKPFDRGRVILLFQPAEETGQGAKAVIDDPVFEKLEPDYVFALHNLPGYNKHSIIIGEGQMTPTVSSMAIKLGGSGSHAAEPDKGINPTLAVSTLNMAITGLANKEVSGPSYSMITPVHTIIGSRDYGISPGDGEVHFTLRTWNEEAMNELRIDIEKVVSDTCTLHRLEYQIEEFDYFPSVVNSRECNDIVTRAAIKSVLDIQILDRPINFGEDFGFFSQKYPCSLFGLGAGEEALPLHHQDYDFEDELIETGIKIFKQIITFCLKK
jgi:amidohydrolase